MKTTKETVEEMYDKATTDDAEPVEAPPAAAEPAAAAASEVAREPTPEPVAASVSRSRDESGRFAKGAKAPTEEPPAPAVAAAPVVPEKPTTTTPDLRPPANWRPVAKEKWGALPREVQEEALRVHAEVAKTLNDTAEARKESAAFREALTPYRQSLGQDPVRGVAQLADVAHRLATGSPDEVAVTLARVLHGYGIQRFGPKFIEKVAAALEGQPASSVATPAAQRPEDIQAIVRKQLEQERATQAQAAETEAIRAFEATRPEFLNDVLDEMYTIVGLEKQRGKQITLDLLKQAHAKALLANDQTRTVLEQRKAAQAANASQASTQQRAAAAAGIKNEPAGPTGSSKAKSTREEVERQIARLSGRARV